MLAWESFEFSGIAPRLRKKLLPRGFATVAHNVDLTHGTLKPFLEPRYLKTVSDTQTQLYIWGCDILTWDKCVDVAEWLPDCPRLFITGNAPYPQTITKEHDNYVYRRLGVLNPPSAPVAIAVDKKTDKSRSVAYMTTFVNNFGEESGPSAPSNQIVIEDGDTVDLDFRYNPPLEYDIQKIRIYRRETGYNTGLEKEQELHTHWFFVNEVDVSTRDYVDTTKIINLGWAFDGLEVREPPATLKNITAIPNSAILAGSDQNKLLFSHNLQPNNWELSQEMTLDDNVVSLGATGLMLYVATDGHPYRVQADAGCDKRACRDIYRYTQPFPMINCHVGHGSVVTPFGFIYASTMGLVLLTTNDNPKVISSDVLSEDDWRQLAPHTTRLAYHAGALYVVTEKISFILWLDSSAYDDTKYKKMVTISDELQDMMESRQGELMLLQNNGDVVQWNAGNHLRPYRWVSADIDTGFLFDLTRVRALVLSNSVAISTISERAKFTRYYPTGDRSIPFNRHGRVKLFNIEVTGVGEVTELVAGVCNIDMGSKE